MTDEEIRREVLAIVARHAAVDEATLTLTTTFEDLRLGSLDVVQILFAIEDSFDVYVEADNQRLRSTTLGDVCDAVRALIASRHG